MIPLRPLSLKNFDNLEMTNTKLENNNLDNIIFSDKNRHLNIISFINGDVNGSLASKLTLNRLIFAIPKET